ncbi:MAG: C_GCAxxG_C_C family protein [Chloroflexi bacterium]|nr:C_GCAxxG_C_C family protein [Chloroflexota bacterium]
MMEDMDRIIELKQQGFFCSQVLLIMGLEMQGKANPDLVRAAQGLAGGLGFTGELCGALSGGATLLGLYAGKGTPEQEDDPRLHFMIEDLVKWFKTEYGEPFGGIRCEEIIAGDSQNTTRRCPLMVAGVFQKVKELLVENGYDLSGLVE